MSGVLEALRRGKKVLSIGGYAGTGKTTIISALVEQLGGRAVVVAPTGKAASVLRAKGNNGARTLHSLMYHRPKLVDGKLIFDNLRESIDADIVIVDESSMVGRQVFDDLLAFNRRAILVGDHGQLEPVERDRGWRNPTFDPDFELATIHRNAGPIARFADHLRHEQPASTFHEDTGAVVVTKKINDETLLAADQIITAWNQHRRALNQKIRTLRGFTGALPKVGERLVSDESKNGLYTGQQGIVTEITMREITLQCDTWSSGPIKYSSRAFTDPNVPRLELDRRAPHRFDFAYAITAHKAQGSEWDHVVAYEPHLSELWTKWRWDYTAATRARTKLTWVLP